MCISIVFSYEYALNCLFSCINYLLFLYVIYTAIRLHFFFPTNSSESISGFQRNGATAQNALLRDHALPAVAVER